MPRTLTIEELDTVPPRYLIHGRNSAFSPREIAYQVSCWLAELNIPESSCLTPPEPPYNSPSYSPTIPTVAATPDREEEGSGITEDSADWESESLGGEPIPQATTSTAQAGVTIHSPRVSAEQRVAKLHLTVKKGRKEIAEWVVQPLEDSVGEGEEEPRVAEIGKKKVLKETIRCWEKSTREAQEREQWRGPLGSRGLPGGKWWPQGLKEEVEIIVLWNRDEPQFQVNVRARSRERERKSSVATTRKELAVQHAIEEVCGILKVGDQTVRGLIGQLFTRITVGGKRLREMN